MFFFGQTLRMAIWRYKKETQPADVTRADTRWTQEKEKDTRQYSEGQPCLPRKKNHNATRHERLLLDVPNALTCRGARRSNSWRM